MRVKKMIFRWEVFIFFLFFLYAAFSDSDVLTIKIVEDIDNNWANNLWNQPQTKLTLEPKVKEANFSGPSHFKSLLGKCYEKVTTSYRYVFCPFRNVTQHEISLQWKPYNGILGVWQEWEIENNTFSAMLMRDGDKCGSIYRSVRVVFTCASKNQVSDVSEPQLCHYLLHFETPLVCQKQSMFVYPYLSSNLKDAWDEIEGELLRKEITEKGYKKELVKIFTAAGFFLSDETKKDLAKNISKKTADNEKTETKFESLEKCSAEYTRLLAEMEGLRTLISLTARLKEQERKEDEETPGYKSESSSKEHTSSPLLKNRKKKN